MATFNDGEGGLSVRTKINASITKTDLITVTGAVDLDSAVIYKGLWDAGSGNFPGGGTAKIGDKYRVNGAGTVDGINFQTNDMILALIDNASTTTFSGNWNREDNTPPVTLVAGKFGDVTLVKADITDFSDGDYATAAQGTLADSAQQPPSEGAFVDGDKTKLDGIATGAEVNTIDSVTAGEPTGSDQVLNVVSLTQAEYDAGTPVSTTFYIING